MYALFGLFLFLSSLIFADSSLSLRGFISYEDQPDVQQLLTELKAGEQETLIIELSSSSGNLEETFDMARQISEMKQSLGLHVVVFIEDRAIGPAAMIPLLADKLYVTPTCVWGDLVYNVNQFIGLDVIKIEVASLVPSQPTLQHVAQAMIDPSLQIAGIHQGTGGPLILGTKQMTQLGLITEVLTDEQFHQMYPALRNDLGSTAMGAAFERELEEYIRVYPVGVNLVGYLDLGHGEVISEKTYLYVKYALEEYVKKSVSCILLNLDTPGGELLSALKISSLLQTVDLVHNIPVICFIHQKAIASGALIAYSCRFIGASSLAVMGAPEDGESVPDGAMTQAPERVTAALRAEMGTVASFFGRNSTIAEAMVDPGIVLILRDGQVQELKPNQPLERNDQILSDEKKLLTLHGEELLEFQVAQFIVQPAVLPDPSQSQINLGRWPAAYELAFQQPYLKGIPNAQMMSYSSSKLGLYAFLTHPLVISLLIVGLLLGIYVEMQTPGFGAPGAIAIACLITLIGVNFIIHTVGWVEIIMLIAGVLCLLLEIFLASGIGVIGILGMGLTLLGLFVMIMPGVGKMDLFNPESFVLFFNVIVYRTVCFVLAIAFTIITSMVLSSLKKERFKSLSKLMASKGKIIEVSRISEEILPKVGDTGEAYTALAPGGKVQIGNFLYEGRSAMGFIEKGKQIVVVRVEGELIIVKVPETYQKIYGD